MLPGTLLLGPCEIWGANNRVLGSIGLMSSLRIGAKEALVGEHRVMNIRNLNRKPGSLRKTQSPI